MKNVRNQKSGNRDGRNSTASTTVVTGNKHSNGDSIRPNDGNEQTSIGRDANGSSGEKSNNGDVERSVDGNPRAEITTGYYFTPNGTIERIPNGYYINNDGRLRKRRGSDGRNTVDGNENRNKNRTETGGNGLETPEMAFLDEEKPLSVRGGKRRGRKPKEETTKLTMVTMLATGCTAIATSIALLTKHDHWSLHVDEAKHLAEALNDAISTLPTKYYDTIIAVIEKWIPWINLIFVIGAIVIPRIEASAKLVEESHYKQSDGSDIRNDGTTNNHFSSKASVGWNN